MKRYQHIMASVDFSELAPSIVEHAKEMAAISNARLSLLHVVQDVPLMGEPFGEPSVLVMSEEVEQQAIDNARQQMQLLVKRLELPDTVHQWIEPGFATDTILTMAEANHVDLIIVGHSGRKGFLGFLGSTANAVVKGANCDVLVVRAH